MGMVHKIVRDSCEDFYAQMKRYVSQTPKSFLQFLSDYKMLYNQKVSDIVVKANRVEIGLEKLQAGAKDVEKMNLILAQEEV
jgi:dynein heavy chain